MTPRDRQRRRLPRRHAFRPGRENLEPRIALSGAQIGVNLDFNWLGRRQPHLDRPPQHRRPLGGAGDLGPRRPVTADGYPLADASTWFDMVNYPQRQLRVQLHRQRHASRSTSVGTLVGPVTTANGVTTGTVRVELLDKAITLISE